MSGAEDKRRKGNGGRSRSRENDNATIIEIKGQEDIEEDSTKTTKDSPKTTKDVVDKLDLILAAINKMSTNMNGVFKLVKDIAAKPSVTDEVTRINEDVNKNTKDTLEKIVELVDVTKEQKELLIESSQSTMETEAEKLKQNILQTWNHHLFKRRDEYWKSLRNKRKAEQYKSWKEQHPIILPQKYQMRAIRDEPELQRKRRERQVVDNFQSDIEIIQLIAESHEARYKAIDDEMETFINGKFTGNKRLTMKKLWDKDVAYQETISEKRWDSTTGKFNPKYEAKFKEMYESKNPFIKADEVKITFENSEQNPKRLSQPRQQIPQNNRNDKQQFPVYENRRNEYSNDTVHIGKQVSNPWNHRSNQRSSRTQNDNYSYNHQHQTSERQRSEQNNQRDRRPNNTENEWNRKGRNNDNGQIEYNAWSRENNRRDNWSRNRNQQRNGYGNYNQSNIDGDSFLGQAGWNNQEI